jgi:hypothetical protein
MSAPDARRNGETGQEAFTLVNEDASGARAVRRIARKLAEVERDALAELAHEPRLERAIAAQRHDPDTRRGGRGATEPKVRGSNPLGRVVA